jgi:hypothetical protein
MRITFRRVAFIAGALLLLFIGCVGYALLRPAPPIVVSKRTTYLTEPLGADGLPDFGLAILQRQREGVTPENNGAIPFWQAMWPGEFTPSDRHHILRELEMSEPAVGLREPYSDEEIRHELMYLLLKHHGHETLAEAYRARPAGKNNPYDFVGMDGEREMAEYTQVVNRLLDQIGQPWTAAQVPPLAKWLEENEALIDLLVEAGNRPKFYSPSPSLVDGKNDSLIAVLLPELQSIRAAARSLCNRALFEIGNGDYDAAWRDLVAGYRLSDHVSNQFTLIHILVAIGCNGIMDHATLHLLDRPDLPPELAKQIFDELQARPPRRAMVEVISEGERLTYLDAVIRLSRGEEGVGGIPALLAVSIDWNLVLRDSNDWYDRLTEAGRIEKWAQRQDALETLESEFVANVPPSPTKIASSLFSRTGRSRRLSEVLRSLLSAAMSAALTAEDRTNTQADLMRLAAALAVYRAEKGSYPDSLDALVPEVLDKLPVDLFHEKPFVYQKTANGYLLYSMGANGQDDGGSNEQMGRYKGYRADERNASVVRELLGQPVAEEEGDETENAARDDDSDAAGIYSHLTELIPAGADDHAIRLPRPKIPLPDLVE